jgi:peptidoglycan/xylan/chitin deacetylase (PgdA/CDA1 family)
MPDRPWQPTLLVRASLLLHALALTLIGAAPGQWRWVLGVVLADHGWLMLCGLWPRSQALGANWNTLPVAAAARGEVALTIDDGPDPAVTPQVLDILDRYAVRATFFCIGDNAAKYPQLCREIVRRGHAVENHSQHHRHHFSLLGPGGLRREVQAAQDTLSAITGTPPRFFRAPAGLRNPFLDAVLTRQGLRLVSWSTRAFDTRIGDAGRVRKKLLGDLRAGAIILMHDGNAARTPQGLPVIVEVLPALLERAAADGLRLVTLRQARS